MSKLFAIKSTKKLNIPILLALFAFSSLLASPAFAGPIYQFSISQGSQPSNVGVITLTQISNTTVDVLVDLSDTSLPLPEYGFVNTGGPHTPFAFTLAGPETGISATFIQPSGGTYTFGMFSLSTSDGGDTPYGTFGISINSSAANGSSNAYYGDLEFQVTRTSGLSTDDFITNAGIDIGDGGPAYFAADLTDGRNTGSQMWLDRVDPPAPVPEPSTLILLGTALSGLVVFRRRLAR